MSIKVFSKPACPGCFGTYHYLTRAGLEYETIDITQDPEAAEYVASLAVSRLRMQRSFTQAVAVR